MNILDPNFKYVQSIHTSPEYLREKFARITLEMASAAKVAKPAKSTKSKGSNTKKGKPA